MLDNEILLMEYLVLTFFISIDHCGRCLVGYTVREHDFRRKNNAISVFCCEPKKELDDASSEPVYNNKTPSVAKYSCGLLFP